MVLVLISTVEFTKLSLVYKKKLLRKKVLTVEEVSSLWKLEEEETPATQQKVIFTAPGSRKERKKKELKEHPESRVHFPTTVKSS